MQRVGRIVALILDEMEDATRAGITTAALDAVGETAMKRHGVRSAPQREYGFPGFTCISINDEIVHGVPGDRTLLAGDVVKIDVTAELDGYVADAARTVFVAKPAERARRLRECAVAALSAAIDAAHAGQPVSVIGRAVERCTRRDGFAVIRELCGHGVGRRIHEPPHVPNYEDRWSGDVLTEGLVIAVEPMLAERSCRPVQGADGWTITTGNGALAVHQEHTVVVRAGRAHILTTAA